MTNSDGKRSRNNAERIERSTLRLDPGASYISKGAIGIANRDAYFSIQDRNFPGRCIHIWAVIANLNFSQYLQETVWRIQSPLSRHESGTFGTYLRSTNIVVAEPSRCHLEASRLLVHFHQKSVPEYIERPARHYRFDYRCDGSLSI